ncbi:hypothetical protein [Flammeovirga sp. SJP92]|uniref:hypothetical protein n=1 Tax=Flammeovirga sp. SJP92 TaxID=1775430 RepID=UPI0007898109|nr:hypothetical protein [Flammeovirga sp. SJP92]KXX67581.1 hypothetical protein AVL50_26335 [Flammeovirga sp. SJP92]
MKLSTTSKLASLFVATALFGLTSCEKNDEPSAGGEETEKTVFHIAADVADPDGDATVFMQPTANLVDTTLTFINNGYQMEGVRSARVTTAGGRVYNLNYGTGEIYELEHDGGSSYTKVQTVNLSKWVGEYPRFAAVSDDYILAHNVLRETSEDQRSITVTLQVVKVGLPGLVFNEAEDYVQHELGTFSVGEDYVFRVDAPVISGNKVYYGTGYRTVGEPDAESTPRPDEMASIILDWPSLANPKIVTTDASQGDTYGYRGTAMFVHEDYVYQINMTTGGSDAVITRLDANGNYDANYEFNITDVIGRAVGSINFHHVGGGKGYVALDDLSLGSDVEDTYDMAYFDVTAKTVEVLSEVPKSNMWYYQSGAIEDDKFYMAVSPSTENAYIWEFSGTDAVKGAQLDGGNVFVQGVYK